MSKDNIWNLDNELIILREQIERVAKIYGVTFDEIIEGLLFRAEKKRMINQ